MDAKRSPQFQTQPEHADSPPQSLAIFRMKVTATGLGTNKNLIQCVSVSADNATVGKSTYTARQSQGHSVGEYVYLMFPQGGTGELFNSRPVTMAEISGMLPPGGTLYQVLQRVDSIGTPGWDWVRAVG